MASSRGHAFPARNCFILIGSQLYTGLKPNFDGIVEICYQVLGYFVVVAHKRWSCKFCWTCHVVCCENKKSVFIHGPDMSRSLLPPSNENLCASTWLVCGCCSNLVRMRSSAGVALYVCQNDYKPRYIAHRKQWLIPMVSYCTRDMHASGIGTSCKM